MLAPDKKAKSVQIHGLLIRWKTTLHKIRSHPVLHSTCLFIFVCLLIGLIFLWFCPTRWHACMLYGSQLKMIIVYVSTYICILCVRAKSLEAHATYTSTVWNLRFSHAKCVCLRANMGMSTKLTTYFIAHGIESVPSVQNKMLANKNDNQVTLHKLTLWRSQQKRNGDRPEPCSPNDKSSPYQTPYKGEKRDNEKRHSHTHTRALERGYAWRVGYHWVESSSKSVVAYVECAIKISKSMCKLSLL